MGFRLKVRRFSGPIYSFQYHFLIFALSPVYYTGRPGVSGPTAPTITSYCRTPITAYRLRSYRRSAIAYGSIVYAGLPAAVSENARITHGG